MAPRSARVASSTDFSAILDARSIQGGTDSCGPEPARAEHDGTRHQAASRRPGGGIELRESTVDWGLVESDEGDDQDWVDRLRKTSCKRDHAGQSLE